MGIPTVSPREKRVLWTSSLAGPIVWSLYFLTGYFLVEIVCKSDFLGFSLFGMQAVSAIILILTIISVGIILYAGWVNYRKWRGTPQEDGLDLGNTLSNEPARFMALSGLLLSGLFTLVTLLTGVAVFILRPC